MDGGWNVTKTPKLVLTTHEREWRDSVSGPCELSGSVKVDIEHLLAGGHGLYPPDIVGCFLGHAVLPEQLHQLFVIAA
jgi:hypothetical protein